MKKTFLILLIAAFAMKASSQTSASINTSVATNVKVPALDKSPLDVSYFPLDYPMIKTQNRTTQPPLLRVIYSRPQRDNRVIFGGLIAYGEVWRLGANEATEIEFFKDAKVGGKKVPKGRYTIYAIPFESKWTVIINKDTDTWGAFVYDQKKDVARIDVPVQILPAAVEPFSMSFSKTDLGANLSIAWEFASATIPIEIK